IVEDVVVDLENNEIQHAPVANDKSNGLKTLEARGTVLNAIEKFFRKVEIDPKRAGFRPSIPFMKDINILQLLAVGSIT
ncbi:hypothetical protein GcM1_176005, partial [Golovinomyces cichoracearum]